MEVNTIRVFRHLADLRLCARCFRIQIALFLPPEQVSNKANLHDTTSRIRLLYWRMKTIADATIPVPSVYGEV